MIPTPRVNNQMLPKYAGSSQLVRLVGKVLQAGQATIDIETSDKGHVRVLLLPGSLGYSVGKIVEIVGKVNQDLSVQEAGDQPTFYSPNFDLGMYDQLLVTQQQYSEIFGL